MEVIKAIEELFLIIESLEAGTMDCFVDVKDDKELVRVVKELFLINIELEAVIMKLRWSVDDILSGAGEADKVSLANNACIELLSIRADPVTRPCVVIITDVETDGELCATAVP